MKNLNYYIRKVASAVGIGTYRFIGRVIPKEKKSHGEVLKILAEQHPNMTVRELEDLFEKYLYIIKGFVSEGYNVETIIGVISYSLKGEFNDMVDHFDASRHQKRGNLTLNSELKEAIKSIQMEKVATPKQGPDLVTITDGINENAEEFTVLQSGLIAIEGTEVKVAGNDELESTDEGVYFVKDDGTSFKCTAMVLNTPKKVIAVVPPNIEPGDYKVKILTYRFGTYTHQQVLEGVCNHLVTVLKQNTSTNIKTE